MEILEYREDPPVLARRLMRSSFRVSPAHRHRRLDASLRPRHRESYGAACNLRLRIARARCEAGLISGVWHDLTPARIEQGTHEVGSLLTPKVAALPSAG